jgi:DNA-binding FadR family transcriptional regulator
MPSFRISDDKLALAEDLLEALEVRIAIESEAAALAARRRTTEQLDASKNPCVTRALMIHCVRNGDGVDHGAGTGAV